MKSTFRIDFSPSSSMQYPCSIYAIGRGVFFLRYSKTGPGHEDLLVPSSPKFSCTFLVFLRLTATMKAPLELREGLSLVSHLFSFFPPGTDFGPRSVLCPSPCGGVISPTTPPARLHPQYPQSHYFFLPPGFQVLPCYSPLLTFSSEVLPHVSREAP